MKKGYGIIKFMANQINLTATIRFAVSAAIIVSLSAATNKILVSEGKPTESSSIYDDLHNTSFGNDGSFTKPYSSKMMVTGKSEYWWVDLEATYTIESAVMFFETSTYVYLTVHYTYYFVNERPTSTDIVPSSATWCDTFKGNSAWQRVPEDVIQANNTLKMQVSNGCGGRSGRYFIIKGTSNDRTEKYLYFYELQLYSLG